jgi:hypothetical protein
MSSPTPSNSDHPAGRLARAAAALLLALIASGWGAEPAAASVPLPVAAVLTGNGQTTLVVDLGASTRPTHRTVEVTLDGVAQPAELAPVMSDGLAVTLVVDASAAGAGTLPAWLSAAARFILEAPPTAQAVVIADRRPATVLTPALRGPTGVVRALTTVQGGGDRDTAAALALACRQFPQLAPGRRVAVLYTTAAGAGGLAAAALASRFQAAGTILVVVGTAGDAYWSDAAPATGGFFAPAGQPVVVPALDQVESTLRGRYLVRFPTPAALPAQVSVRVDTGDLTLTADAVVPPAPPMPSPDKPPTRTIVWTLAVAAGVAVALAAVLLAVGRARRPRMRPLPPGLATVFRGQASVPPSPMPHNTGQPPTAPSPDGRGEAGPASPLPLSSDPRSGGSADGSG